MAASLISGEKSLISGEHDDPDASRPSFHHTIYERAQPFISARFPQVDPLYLIKIFRGTIGATGLVWLDHDRETATPSESYDLSHLLYCFEIYGQIVCMFAADGIGIGAAEELQRALADHRIRLLKLAKVCTFESLKEFHETYLAQRLRYGQDKPEAWRERREDLAQLLRRRDFTGHKQSRG